MRWVTGFSLIWLCLARAALAGAWLQETGESFVSAKVVARGGAIGGEAALYGEYGLRPGLTLGLDLNRRADGTGHAMVFARLPVIPPGPQGRLALQAGAGLHRSPGSEGAMGRLGLLYGRGLGADGSGWLGVAAAVEARQGTAAPLYKLDGVIGLPGGGRVQPMISVETFYADGAGLGWSVTPAVILGARGGVRWVAGLEYRAGAGARSAGVTLGLWRRF